MSRDIQCVNCEKPLSGGLDTYGDVGSEMCWPCYSLWRIKNGFTLTPGLIESAQDIELSEETTR